MKTKIRRHISPAAIAIALFFAWALVTHGAIVRVTNPNGNGAGSLRQALLDTTGGEIITFRGPAWLSIRTRTAYRVPLNVSRYIGQHFLQYFNEDKN
jgi:hypothetical protein